MRLLPPDALVRTNSLDRADWYYRPMLGSIIKKRFDLILSLLPLGPIHSLLEIGYGSGVFLPELARHATSVFGADIHRHADIVTAALESVDVTATLCTADVTSLPYEDGAFDVVISASCLEYVHPIEDASLELQRVLSPRGSLIVVTPARSPVIDKGFRLLTGRNAAADFAEANADVVRSLRGEFTVSERRRFPAIGPAALTLYHVARLRPRVKRRSEVWGTALSSAPSHVEPVYHLRRHQADRRRRAREQSVDRRRGGRAAGADGLRSSA